MTPEEFEDARAQVNAGYEARQIRKRQDGTYEVPQGWFLARTAFRYGKFRSVGDPRKAQHTFRCSLLSIYPEVLQEFRDTVGPIYAECLRTSAEPGIDRIVTRRALDQHKVDGDWPGTTFAMGLAEAVRKWAKKHRLDYDWIVDPALLEVYFSWRREGWDTKPLPLGALFALSSNLHAIPDIPKPDVFAWDPLSSTWDHYLRIARARLVEYRRAVEALMREAGYVEHKQKRRARTAMAIDGEAAQTEAAAGTDRHYVWLVRRVVKGQSWGQIGQPDWDAKAVKDRVLELALECCIDLDHVRGRQRKGGA